MTQDEALKLAEDYAHMRAIWYVESLYGTSASHTELREKVMLGAHQALKKALAQEQEPVAWLITDEKINSLQVDSIQRLVDRARYAHMTDIKLRINGQDEWHQADWLKHLTRTTPPQRSESSGKPSAWVGLTDEDISEVVRGTHNTGSFVRAIEAKLKEKNT